MKVEFERFRLSNVQRKITGVLQLLGGVFLLLGLVSPLIGVIAAGGLSIQMLLGFIVRLRIKDTLIQSLPSFIFMIINGYIFMYFLDIYR